MPLMSNDDLDLVVLLAGCSLEEKSGDRDNWVERTGSGGQGGKLPEYICRIARAIHKSGRPKSQAIAIAVSRVKRWAAGEGDVNADTRAKAAKAVAQWEAMKTKNKAKGLVRLTGPEGDYVALTSVGEFSTSLVTSEWSRRQKVLRLLEPEVVSEDTGHADSSFSYILDVWTTFIIVERRRAGRHPEMFKVPYSVADGEVSFEDPIPVQVVYEPIPSKLSKNESSLLEDLLESAVVELG